MDSYTYAYLVIAGIYLLLSLAFFIRLRKLRVPMLVAGIVLLSAGPVSEFFHIPDYWNPSFIWEVNVEMPMRKWRFGLEDIIGTIGFAGFSIAIFEIIYKKPLTTTKKWEWIPAIKMALLGLAGLLIMVFCFFVLGISGIYAGILSMVAISMVSLWISPIYVKAALISAFISAAVYWAVLQFILNPLYPGIFYEVWNPRGRIGLMVAAVPLEEIIWAFFGTLFAGPVYRLTHSPDQTK